MVPYYGDYPTGATIYIPINTFDSNDPAASVTVTNLVNTDVHIHKDGGTTQRNNAAGITMTIDFDSITGGHMLIIDSSDNTVANFYQAGHEYQVRVEGITVDGGTINAFIATFSIERSGGALALIKNGTYGLSALNALLAHADYGLAKLVRSTTPANTLAVGATGLVAVPDTQKVDLETIKTRAITCAAGVTVLANLGFAGAPGASNGAPTTNGTKINQTVDLTAGQSIACSDKTGFSLSATGADLILKSSTFVQAIVAAVNEFATYGLTALNTLLVTTGIKAASIPAVTLAASQHVIVDSGTVTTLTNLPAAPTDWLTASAVKADAIAKIWAVLTSGLTTAGSIGKKLADWVVGTIDTYTGNTKQTGDTYARLGAPAGASVSADVAALKAETAAILVDTGTTLDDLIDTEIATIVSELAKVPKSDSNVSWNATALAAINAEMDTALNTAIPGSPAADSINERIATMDTTAIPAIKTVVDTIQADTDLLDDAAGGLADIHTDIGTALTNIAAVKTVVDTIQADTDLLDDVSGGIADIHTDVASARSEISAVKTVVDTIQADTDLLDDAIGGLADIHADIATMQGNVTDILADTNELELDWKNSGRLDLILDAAKDEATRARSIAENKMEITDATGAVTLYADDSLTPLLTGTVNDNSTTTTRSKLA